MQASANSVIDPELFAELAEGVMDAWNRHDPEAVASLCAEDVSWADAALPAPARGRAEVAAFVVETAHMLPDFHVERLELSPLLSPEQPIAFVPYRMSGTMLGAWRPQGIAPTNRHFSIEGIDRWTLRGGLIVDYTPFYDSLELSRQLGLLPRAGSRGERLLTRMQRVQALYLRHRAPRS